MNLVPCPSCGRHVKASDAACPFCAGIMPQKAALTGRTLGVRAAMFFGASAVVVACGGKTECTDDRTDCTSSSSSTSSSGAPVYGAPVAMYGAPAPGDAGSDATGDGGSDASSDATVNDATSDAPVAAYGGPGP
ncbi:MAG: hypothetical protein U0174_09260 [Polyangiaceae bacterium]